MILEEARAAFAEIQQVARVFSGRHAPAMDWTLVNPAWARMLPAILERNPERQ